MILVDMDWRLTLDTGVNLTGYTSLSIQYIKPLSGTVVSSTATQIDSTKAYIDITAATNDTAGKWLFRVCAVIAGLTYYSTPVHVNVRDDWHPWEGA